MKRDDQRRYELLDLNRDYAYINNPAVPLMSRVKEVQKEAKKLEYFVEQSFGEGLNVEDSSIEYKGIPHPFLFSHERITERILFHVNSEEQAISDFLDEDPETYRINGRISQGYYIKDEIFHVNCFIDSIQKSIKENSLLLSVTEDLSATFPDKADTHKDSLLNHEIFRIRKSLLSLKEQLVFLQQSSLYLVQQEMKIELEQLRAVPINREFCEPSYIVKLKKADLIEDSGHIGPYRLKIPQGKIRALYEYIQPSYTFEEFGNLFIQRNGEPLNRVSIERNIDISLTRKEVKRLSEYFDI